MKHDSHWTSDKISVGLGFLQEKKEQARDDDGSVGVYGNQQCDVGTARSVQSTPCEIGMFNSNDGIDCKVL